MTKQIFDRRAEKRMLRKMGHTELYFAYNRGNDDAYRGKNKNNIYPPGKRHDEYERGYGIADPLGNWHGTNR